MNNLNHLKTLAFISIVSMITACGGGSLSKDYTLSNDEGMMLLKVMSNSVLNDPKFPFWHTLTLKRLDAKPATLMTIKPSDSLQGYANTLTFARSLPTGKYTVTTLSSNTKNKPNEMQVKKFGFTFEVKPGHLTNLGTLVYQPQGNLLSRKTFSFGHESDDEGAKRLVNKHFPALAKQVLSKPIVHMRKSQDYNRRKAVVKHAKANSAVLNGVNFSDRGYIYAGGRFGQVLTKEFDWQRHDTGYNMDITSVLPLERNKLLASGEDGLLLVSTDRGQKWKQVTPPDNNSWIARLVKTHKGEVIALSVKGSEASLYKTTSVDTPNWQKMKQFSMDKNNLHGTLPVLRVGTDKLTVVADDTVYSYNFANNGWNSEGTPFDAVNLEQQYEVMEDGTILAYQTAKKMYRVFKSVNGGKKWEKQGATLRISSMAFLDGQTGYSINPKPGTAAEKVVLQTKDGGKTWSMASNAPALENPRLVTDSYNQIIYMVGASGKVYFSSDFAQSWTPLRNVAWFE